MQDVIYETHVPDEIIFQTCFISSYKHYCHILPCFGSLSNNTSQDWWSMVIALTYTLALKDADQRVVQEMNRVLPRVCQTLHDDVFGTAVGWELMPHAKQTIEKLVDIKLSGKDPRLYLGVVSDFDVRLHDILQCNTNNFMSTKY
jgi:hypothetical protein